MPVSWFMARQFARPRGVFGRLFLGGMLDRANVRSNALMFDVAAVSPSEHVLEVGFGGGDLLIRLAKTVSDGRVEGVELSEPMLGRVRARIRRRGLADWVRLHAGSVEALLDATARFHDYREDPIALNARVPLLYIVREEMGPRVSRWAARHTPSARVEAFGGHMMFRERADEFNRLLSGFLARCRE